LLRFGVVALVAGVLGVLASDVLEELFRERELAVWEVPLELRARATGWSGRFAWPAAGESDRRELFVALATVLLVVSRFLPVLVDARAFCD
jgi:hypothetical protein